MRDLARALVALLVVLALAHPARAQELAIPRNDGWVTDAAHVLSQAEEAEFEARLADFEKRTTNEIALLTVSSLDGQPIERFALEVGRAWKMGKVGKNNTALLVVAVQDRELRIEVGRGLEGDLTDALCGRVIRDVIVPRFKAGDMPGGIRAGLAAILQIAGGAGSSALPAQQVESSGPGDSVLLLVVLPLAFLVLIGILSRRLRGPFGRGPFSGPGGFGGLGGFGTGGGGFGGGGFSGGGFGGFGGGGGFSGGGASGRW